MALKLIITLDNDMDRFDGAMIAQELDEVDGVAEIEGDGWNPWDVG